jgi:uncharacterized Fe-S cluster-containing MiaB family protein
MNKLLRRQLGLKKADKVLRVWHSRDKYAYEYNPADFIEIERQGLYKTRKSCSCLMCGNRRRWAGATIQERKSELLLVEAEQ